jgi:iron complex outermembrane receptor protein|tara:strand:+ start:12673 stop:14922 length:2250 start_codon:yes stop_codon:yes gene_type:complete
MSQNQPILLRVQAIIMSIFLLGSTASYAEPATLEEIIVTSQKRTESLMEVSSAVSAFSNEDMGIRQINSVMDLSGSLPSVAIGNNLGIAAITIRGVGMDSIVVGTDPSVAMHLDGVVITRAQAQLGSFFDLERVEVVRGPSGTLYGRNATGGSLNLVTNKPTEEFEGYGRVTVGDYSSLITEGAIGGALTESVLGRVAFKTEDRDGYGKNLTTKTDINDAKKRAVRGQLQFLINPDLDVLLAVEYSDEDDHNYMTTYIEDQFPGNPKFPRTAGLPDDPRDTYQHLEGRNRKDTWAATGTINWSLNEQWTLKSITSYRDFTYDPEFEPTMSSATNRIPLQQFIEYDQFSQEFQFNYQSDRVAAVTGLYYYDESTFHENKFCFATTCEGLSGPDDWFGPAPPFVNGIVGNSIGTTQPTSFAAFANIKYALTDQLELMLGARYSDEKRIGTTIADYSFGRRGQPNKGVRAGTTEKSFTDFSPEIGLNWSPTDYLLVYASYKEAFKSGIFPLGRSNAETGGAADILDPETIEASEIGLKGRFLENQLHLSLSAFNYDLTDQQVSRTQPQPGGISTTQFENAAGSEIQGVEMEVTWLASESLQIEASIGYLDATYTDYESVNNLDEDKANFPFTTNAKGNTLSYAPKRTGRIRADYSFQMPSLGSAIVGVEAQYKSEVSTHAWTDARMLDDSRTVLQANLAITSMDEKWSLNIWGKNLTDEFFYVYRQVMPACNCIGGGATAPRTYGATVAYNF